MVFPGYGAARQTVSPQIRGELRGNWRYSIVESATDTTFYSVNIRSTLARLRNCPNSNIREIYPRAKPSSSRSPPPCRPPGEPVGADRAARWFNKNVKYKVAGGDGRLGNK